MAGAGTVDEGATPRELVLEASRRNNVGLLEEVIKKLSRSTSSKSKAKELIADVLNNAVGGIGNHCLHLTATHGSYDVMDLILDQEGVEVDPLDRLEKETPLHKAVRFVNARAKEDWGDAKALPDLLIDAGADPRIRNKSKLKAIDLVDVTNEGLREALRNTEYALQAGNEIVNRDEDGAGNDAGSASDSD